MAEERAISNFTKLNSSDRGRQKPSTLVRMTQIKQHEQRRRKVPGSKRPTNPAVRFRDLSDILHSETHPEPTSEIDADTGAQRPTLVPTQAAQVDNPGTTPKALEDIELDMWERDAGVIGETDRPLPGARNGFAVAEADGTNLDEPLLLDLLSNDPVPGVIARGGYAITNADHTPAATASSGTSGLVVQPFQF